MQIAFIGNHTVSYSSENHHCATLEKMGHEITRIQENKTTGDEIIQKAHMADLVIWVHTHGAEWEVPNREKAIAYLKNKGIKVITYHLDLWLGLEREKDLNNDPFYKSLDYFFATDALMCDWFNENTNVRGFYIPAGVYDKEAYMSESAGYKHDVIFVGSKGYHPEWNYRPMLIDFLQGSYGGAFAHYGGDGLGTIREAKLNQLYADSKIVVGDTLCHNFTYPHYFSDRLFETTGRGGFLIFPYIVGIENFFEIGKEIVTYDFGNFGQLRKLIDYYLRNDMERERIREAGFERTKNEHTYRHRWQTILQVVADDKA